MNRVVLVIVVALAATAFVGSSEHAGATAKTRTYYIAAEEINWDYAPAGRDLMMGQDFGDAAKVFVARSNNRIGAIYKKARYVEYTDATFSKRKPPPPGSRYLGIVGPIIHAEVGDKIRIVFRNMASRPYSIHPHGVFYTKANEGALSNDGTTGADRADDAVPPGATYVYNWDVPPRAGPGPNDPSSVVWPYHSHVDPVRDANSGLVGAIIVTRQGAAKPDGSPADVDREFVTLLKIFDENLSWYKSSKWIGCCRTQELTLTNSRSDGCFMRSGRARISLSLWTGLTLMPITRRRSCCHWSAVMVDRRPWCGSRSIRRR